MPLFVSRLRRWFAVGATLIALIVTGTFLSRRMQLAHFGQRIPKKIDIKVQQTAEGFTVSKSESGRTVFTIRANNAVQYKVGGHALLHNVTITIFGRDSARFDQIYGANFDYDQQSGIVIAKGEVHIDLEANPKGAQLPDQSAPPELKNPIHLKTSNLVFNQKTGDAYTPERVEFNVSQATGSAVGATYTANDGLLDMKTQVHVVVAGEVPAVLDAVHGTIQKDPRQLEFDQPKVVRGDEYFDSKHATVFLREDSTIDHMIATGDVHLRMSGKQPISAQADWGQLVMTGAEEKNVLRTVMLSGNVQFQQSGPQPVQGDSGKLTVNFRGKNEATTARAQENVKLVQHQVKQNQAKTTNGEAGKQDVIVTAPIIDFFLKDGQQLKSAITSGHAPQIEIVQLDQSKRGQKTVISAVKFNAQFDDSGQISALHGAPNAKIVNSSPGQPDRVSTSDIVDAIADPDGGVQSIVQQGSVMYVDKDLKAWGDRARYTPNDEMLYLNGSPRVIQGGMTTTAVAMRMNRGSGEAFAEGNVKSTYNDLKEQPHGGMFASSDPIHVTSQKMVSHNDPGVATYTGRARLWQVANVVEAPSIEFDRETRSVVAFGRPGEPVATALVQTDNKGKTTPVAITSDRLTYTDSERKAHFEGNVVARGEDATVTANTADAYMKPAGANADDTAQTQTSEKSREQASQLDRLIAYGRVVVTQPGRRAKGDHLVYTADDDKYVLTGKLPSIFDAERGNVTGDSLTFYKRDDRVLVEGEAKSPAVTQTRVAR
jgi:lipopolysaccharide export system protein LptA